MWQLCQITLDAPDALQTWLLALWVFVFGAAIGSFLNVVIYRMPRGESLSHPPSRCPSCGRPIAWYDNVPIIGWLVLRGRCRACGASISPRYPLVESLVALVFLLLAWLEVFGRGVNLPHGPWTADLAIQLLWAVYGYHLFLVCALLAAGFINYDGQTPPVRLFVPALLVGLAAPLLLPGLRPVPYRWPLPIAPSEIRWLAELLTGGAGAAAGLLCGLLTWPAAGLRNNSTSVRRTAMLSLITVGVFLGWQAVTIVALTATILLLLAAIGIRLRLVPPTMSLVVFIAVLTPLWIACWSILVSWQPELGYDSKLRLLIFCGALMAVLAVAVRAVLSSSAPPSSTSRG